MCGMLIGSGLIGVCVLALFNLGHVRAALAQGQLASLLTTWAVMQIIFTALATFLLFNGNQPDIITVEELTRGSGVGTMAAYLLGPRPGNKR